MRGWRRRGEESDEFVGCGYGGFCDEGVGEVRAVVGLGEVGGGGEGGGGGRGGC